MPLRWIFVTLLPALAVLGVLGPCGPAWAHSPFEPGAEVASESATDLTGSGSDGSDEPGQALGTAPEATAFPWPALPVVAAGLALGWWRPRRAAVLAIALLLAVFAFENGLHSVHHGPDQAQASSCPVAVAGAHVSATPVESIAPCDVILPVVALTVAASLSDPIALLARPEQGRAPPPSLV